jgi:exopolysaccharide biosynthesis protein
MTQKFLLIGLFALVASPSALGRPVQLMPGATYERRLEWTAAGPVSTYVVQTPRPGGLYSLGPLLSNGTITGRETVASMERRVSSQMTTVGVNGDFFNWQGGWPSGLLMQGGVLEHHPAQNRSALGIDSTGTLHVDRQPFVATWRGVSSLDHPVAQLNEPPRANSVALFTPVWGDATPAVNGVAVVLEPFPPTAPFADLTATVTRIVTDSSVVIPRDGAVLVGRGTPAEELQQDTAVSGQVTVRLALARDWAAVTDAVGGGPALVRDGKPISRSGESLTAVQLYGRDPRTSIGQRADGSLVIVAVDGRRPGWSVGITNWDLALTLVRYGCVTAFALDSGGSTTVAFDGRVLNRPSDPGGARPVAEALVVGYTGVYAPAPAPTLSPNGDGVGDRETLSYKVVRPSTVSAKLIAPDGTIRELDAGQKPPGSYRLSWDGTDAAGAPAPEGRYKWSVSASDDLNRASAQDRAFTLDNTLGFARVGRNARTIGFRLTRDAAVRVTVEDRYGDILRTVAAGRRAAGPVQVRWNGRDGRRKLIRRGSYVVHVAATSEIGLSELRRSVRIGGR